MPYANNKGADQAAHPRSLISGFIVHCLDSIIPLVFKPRPSFWSWATRFESYLVANPEDRFSRDEAQLLMPYSCHIVSYSCHYIFINAGFIWRATEEVTAKRKRNNNFKTMNRISKNSTSNWFMSYQKRHLLLRWDIKDCGSTLRLFQIEEAMLKLYDRKITMIILYEGS